MRTLGLIPARGGSKRLPGKNMKELCGRPMLWWTLTAALKSWLDDVIVSTDDMGTIDSVGLHAKTIFRPPELSDDLATSKSVIEHALSICTGYDRVMLLQPTSPLRTEDDIDRVLGLEKTTISVRREGTGFVPNGAIYLMDTDKLMEYELCYIMPDEVSVDIDTSEDFRRAEVYIASHRDLY